MGKTEYMRVVNEIAQLRENADILRQYSSYGGELERAFWLFIDSDALRVMNDKLDKLIADIESDSAKT